MASSLLEFQDLLAPELDVDLDRLRDAARHGVPASVRGAVWKYLLGVSRPDQVDPDNVSLEAYSVRQSDRPELARLVRRDVARYVAAHADALAALGPLDRVKGKFERILLAYLAFNTRVEYAPGMASLIGPILLSVRSEAQTLFCLQNLMKKLESAFNPERIPRHVAKFLMMFRSLLPDLYTSFEEEEVEQNEWALAWIQFLFANAMPLPQVCRLWDTYFATAGGIAFHEYVCLAVLSILQEELMDQEASDVKRLLLNLPSLDIDRLIAVAHNLKFDLRSRDWM